MLFCGIGGGLVGGFFTRGVVTGNGGAGCLSLGGLSVKSFGGGGGGGAIRCSDLSPF